MKKLFLIIGLIFYTTLFANLTRLRDGFCNDTLLSLNSPIYAKVVTGATAYKFEIYNPTTGDLVEYEKNTGTAYAITFGYPELIPYAYYTTTYQVRVKAKLNGIWGNYGSMCYLTTPVGSKVREPDNGKTVNLMHYERVYLDLCNFSGVQDYQIRYRVNGTTVYFTATSGTEATPSPIDREFEVADFNNSSLYGKILRISARVLINGVWSEWGVEKIIRVITSPTTKLCDGSYLTTIGYIDHCGTFNDPYIISSTSTILSSYNVFGFSSATFEVCKLDGSGNIIETQTHTRQFSMFGAVARSFRLNMIPSYSSGVNNTTFKIRVKTNLGDYGSECYVRVQNSIDPQPVVYPNPFTNTFKIDSIQANTPVLITDLSGKIMETVIDPTGELGGNLPTGIYYIIIENKVYKIFKN